MYTCDICGIDQLDRENLISVNDNEYPSEIRFYDCCDLLVCSKCFDRYADVLEIVEDC